MLFCVFLSFLFWGNCQFSFPFRSQWEWFDRFQFIKSLPFVRVKVSPHVNASVYFLCNVSNHCISILDYFMFQRNCCINLLFVKWRTTRFIIWENIWKDKREDEVLWIGKITDAYDNRLQHYALSLLHKIICRTPFHRWLWKSWEKYIGETATMNDTILI